MSSKQHSKTEQAREIGDNLGIDWHSFNVEQFRMGHLIRGPYIMFFQPMMKEPGWRSFWS